MRRRPLRKLTLVWLGASTVLALACSTDRAGTEIAEEEAPVWSPIYSTTVDHMIGGGGVDSAGQVVAAMLFADFVIRVRPTGPASDTIGRRGDGPCEFRGLFQVDFRGGDEVVALDSRAQAGFVQMCGFDGAARSAFVPGRPASAERLSDGRYRFLSQFGKDTIALLELWMPPSGQQLTRVDTVARWDLQPIAELLGQRGRPSPLYLSTADTSFVTANTVDSVFRILRIGSNGRIDTIADLDIPPVRYTAAEMDARLDQRWQEMRRSGRPAPDRSTMSSKGFRTTALRFSRRAFAIGDDGTLWARPASHADSLVTLFAFDMGRKNAYRLVKVKAPVSDIAVAGEYLVTFGDSDDGNGVIALYKIKP